LASKAHSFVLLCYIQDVYCKLNGDSKSDIQDVYCKLNGDSKSVSPEFPVLEIPILMVFRIGWGLGWWLGPFLD
jgi:hypothetical protein